MRRTHRLPARLIRWTSLSVCFVASPLIFIVTPLAKPITTQSSVARAKRLAERQGQEG